MTLDLSNIRQATDRESEELPVQSPCNTFPNTCFPYTRWANEADDFAFDRTTKLSNGKEFENSIFDICEAIVILIEDLDGVRDGKVLGRVDTPRDLNFTDRAR